MLSEEATRRAALTGIGATAAIGATVAAGAATVPSPDLGPNVVILDPSMPRAIVQARLDAIVREQERAHFTDKRYCVLLKPGRYPLDVNVGFFTQVAGLGALPGEVVIDGHVHVEADWNKGMALVNFWRGVENLTVRPPDGRDRWAVSQAAPYRRTHLAGDLQLDDGGWSSGGGSWPIAGWTDLITRADGGRHARDRARSPGADLAPRP